jgi:hypothetical protein
MLTDCSLLTCVRCQDQISKMELFALQMLLWLHLNSITCQTLEQVKIIFGLDCAPLSQNFEGLLSLCKIIVSFATPGLLVQAFKI